MNNNSMSLKDLLLMVLKYNMELKEQITQQQLMLTDTFYAMIISNIFNILKEEQFNLESLNTIISKEQMEELSEQTIEYLEQLNINPVQQIELLLKTAIIITVEHPGIQSLAVNIKEAIKNESNSNT